MIPSKIWGYVDDVDGEERWETKALTEDEENFEHWRPYGPYYHISTELIERLQTIGDAEGDHIPSDVGVLLADLLAIIDDA